LSRKRISSSVKAVSGLEESVMEHLQQGNANLEV
jgi:hypothetical protein